MSGLGRRAFVKMNGCGNAIVTLDLRGSGLAVSPAEARAIARAPGLAYDQLMVLHDPKTANTLAFMTIFNNDGSLSAADRGAVAAHLETCSSCREAESATRAVVAGAVGAGVAVGAGGAAGALASAATWARAASKLCSACTAALTV